jgi:aspartyl-tRNA(Asn)/glutamyl-tRNA(Gln) amidotransferase subunit C
MISKNEVKDLADLARINLSPEEEKSLHADLESILEYISKLKDVDLKTIEHQDLGLVKNVMRLDENPHEAGAHTEDLLAQASGREGDFFVVKKIL